MFRDRQQELERIEQQLLQEDPVPQSEEELLRDIAILIGDVQSPRPQAPVEPKRPRPKQKKEDLRGLVIAAILLSAGILALAIWWILRLTG